MGSPPISNPSLEIWKCLCLVFLWCCLGGCWKFLHHNKCLSWWICRLWAEIEAHKWRFLALLVDHILSEVRQATKELSAVLSTSTKYWANILVEGRCIKISSQIDRWNFGVTSVLSWYSPFEKYSKSTIGISYGTVVRDFESEAKTRCNFQFR